MAASAEDVPVAAMLERPSSVRGQDIDEKAFSSSNSRAPSLPPHSPPFAESASGGDEEAQPSTSTETEPEALERWNESNTTMFRYFSTLYSFIVLGMNDASVGALIPYIEPYYHVTYTVISLVFLASFAGYMAAALSNNIIHHRFGQVGIAIIAPLTRIVGYVTIACHPPFAVLPVMLIFPGFGNGLQDSAWNAWIGNMQNANELLGFLHGAYGLGATIAPLIATSMVTKGNLPWYTFFYLMVGMAGLDGCFATAAFWGATGRVHRETHKSTTGQTRTTTRRVLREPLIWFVALFLLGYVGAEVSLGGWIVTFMLNVRHADNFPAGMAVTGFWLGLTIGRVILGFITGRIGEKLAITIYLLLSLVLQLLYWLVPSFIASAVFVGFLGFFLGPLFPAAIVAATKLLPPDFHVSAIGFAAAFGGGGAAVFPFVVGAIAQSKGVIVLQPIVVAIFCFISIIWFFLPGGFRRGGLEYAREHHEGVGHDAAAVFRWLAGRTKRTRDAAATSSPGIATASSTVL